MISKRDGCWPATKHWLEAEIAKEHIALERVRPADEHDRSRGRIEAYRSIIKKAEPEPLTTKADPAPGYHSA